MTTRRDDPRQIAQAAGGVNTLDSHSEWRWGNQQRDALRSIAEWQADPGGKQVYKLFGYAGTGKTSLAQFAAANEENPVFTAYTAKASHVLRQRGCKTAVNIHQLLYSGGGGWALEQDELIPDKNRPAKPSYADDRKDLEFELDPRDDLVNASMIVVDEASMISDEILDDLLPLDKPILALGDPAQLPPIGDDRGALTAGEPDAFLTEIHRSALDSPVVWLSMKAREGEQLPWGWHGESCVIAARFEEVCRSKADQILCGTNRMRHRINDEVRRIRGYEGWLPQPGERLVCLRNQHQLRLSNGTIWICRRTATGTGRRSKLPIIELTLKSEDDPREIVKFNCSIEDFFAYFDYGYCLTTHKSQGSEWPHVVLVDEAYCFGQDAKRWLYTGITRARERISVVRMRKGGLR